MIVLTKIQNIDFFFVENFVDFLFVFIITVRMRIDIASAITPPNLDGIDRRITYANRKYHSGWMCTGATSGFAGEKFSTSPKMLG